MLRTLEPQNEAKNKNAEAYFRNTYSFKLKSLYCLLHHNVFTALPRGLIFLQVSSSHWSVIKSLLLAYNVHLVEVPKEILVAIKWYYYGSLKSISPHFVRTVAKVTS